MNAPDTLVQLMFDEAAAHAERTHREYRQYDHYWDAWVPAVVTRRIRTKWGVVFEAGDVSITDNTPEQIGGSKWFVTVYSVRAGHNVAVPIKDVRLVR